MNQYLVVANGLASDLPLKLFLNRAEAVKFISDNVHREQLEDSDLYQKVSALYDEPGGLPCFCLNLVTIDDSGEVSTIEVFDFIPPVQDPEYVENFEE